MQREAPLTFKSLCFLMLFFLLGCESFDKTPQPELSFKPHAEVFKSDMGKTWRAVQVALSKYPITVNNLDSGIIRTGSVEEYKIWQPPYKKVTITGGHRYELYIKVTKGKVQGQSVAKVSILKKATRKDDFFANPKPQMSDGLEEDAILYRIKRELIIEKALEKAAQAAQ